MDPVEHNRRAWNRVSRTDSPWCQPVDAATIARARAGAWSIVLTPRLPVPRAWFGDLRDRDVLCLASGGGQQVPILAASGARVTSFDNSDEQLEKDAAVAAREGLAVRCVRGDMRDLSAFPDASFDLVVHPCSNSFAPEIAPVWRECARVLRSGGEILYGFTNPDVFLFDHDEADATHRLLVKHALPYADVEHLAPHELERKIARGEPLEYSHSMDDQIGAVLDAGFVVTGFYEDRWFDDSFHVARHMPVAFAVRARRVVTAAR